MAFQRRILHHGPTPTGTPTILSLDAVRNCWFELHRQGGCGSGQLTLASDFDQRAQIELGDWISFEHDMGDRWYLGRMEERLSTSPAEIRYRLEGMTIELNEVFPGGFGEQADGNKPHRYANTDLFTLDPDRGIETFDSADSVTEVITLLLEQYVTPTTNVLHDPSRVESPLQQADISSLKFRGEESVRSLLKELAMRAQSAAWGVDETGTFFFLKPQVNSVATYREGTDLTSMQETRDREYLFNRLLLTGDYVYDRKDQSDVIARRSYRFRGNFIEPISQGQHGDRRIRVWAPWIRTQKDSISFAKEFFRMYSQPTSRFLIETTEQETLLKPWDGRVSLQDQTGSFMTTAFVETVRVQFDHAPTFRMELGPLDPRTLWPEPPHDERWELPEHEQSIGGPVSLPPPLPEADPPGGGGGGGGGSSSSSGPIVSSNLSSDGISGLGSSGGSPGASSGPASSLSLSGMISSEELSSDLELSGPETSAELSSGLQSSGNPSSAFNSQSGLDSSGLLSSALQSSGMASSGMQSSGDFSEMMSSLVSSVGDSTNFSSGQISLTTFSATSTSDAAFPSSTGNGSEGNTSSAPGSM